MYGSVSISVSCFLKKKIILFLFLEREEEGEREERGKHQCVVASQAPPTGNQARNLTGNQTSDLLVCRLVFNPLSHTSQDSVSFLSAETTHFHPTQYPGEKRQ